MKFLISLLTLTFMNLAWAGDFDKKFPPNGKKFKKLISSLNLSEDQESQIKALHRGHKESYKELKEKMKEGQKALHEAMERNESTENLQAMFKGLTDLRTQMMNSRFEKILSIRNILNPEQKEEFSRIYSEYTRRH